MPRENIWERGVVCEECGGGVQEEGIWMERKNIGWWKKKRGGE